MRPAKAVRNPWVDASRINGQPLPRAAGYADYHGAETPEQRQRRIQRYKLIASYIAMFWLIIQMMYLTRVMVINFHKNYPTYYASVPKLVANRPVLDSPGVPLEDDREWIRRFCSRHGL